MFDHCTVTPAVAPKTEVHEDWNRLFFLVTPIDAAHLAGFDIVRADVYTYHPSISLQHSVLVREGQLLPFESSAKTHGMGYCLDSDSPRSRPL